MYYAEAIKLEYNMEVLEVQALYIVHDMPFRGLIVENILATCYLYN